MSALSNDYFFVKKHQKYIRIEVSSIVWVGAYGSSVEIITEKEKVVAYANLSSFCRQIPHPFILRVHRSYAINFLKVYAFDEAFLYLDYQSETKKIPIGKTYKEEMMKRFRQLKAD